MNFQDLLAKAEVDRESEGIQVNFPDLEESKEMIDFEISDDEIFEEYPSHKSNMRTIGLQTSEIHFGKVERTEEFK